MTSLFGERDKISLKNLYVKNKYDLFEEMLYAQKATLRQLCCATVLIHEELLDPNWVAGFVDGEGCFHVGISKNKSRLGQQVLPEFVVVQHIRDIQVLERLQVFFGCGVVRVNNGDRMAFRVRDFSKLCTTIIPFFERYPLQTKKARDLSLFKEVLLLMQEQKHLCAEVIEKIRHIANLMNRNKGHREQGELVELVTN